MALWQAEWVKSALKKNNAGLSIDITTIKTTGDKILDVPLSQVGGKGLFVKEIEEALLDGRIDLAVHSMKDMPAVIPEGLKIGAVPVRENPLDVLISKKNRSLSQLRRGSRIGTSSLRRSAQLRHLRPDLEILPLRGNIDTRIRKLDTGDLDAVILAAAGVKRMGLEDRIVEFLNETHLLPAVGQGALCIEIREKDPRMEILAAGLNDSETQIAVDAERAFLIRMEGSCQIPIAAYAKINGKQIFLEGLISDLEGEKIIRDRISGPFTSSRQIGIALAEKLLNSGGREILGNIFSKIKKGE
ncbi:MAG: hydroxymethylbilane synthase [Thermodesulfobacteriota bacterium]